jgi:hypothetical protein
MPKDRFLPPSRHGESYPGDTSDTQFTAHHISLLSDISEKMEKGEPSTQPRRPSPFSVIWQFSADLKGESTEQRKMAARRRFRGLIALLALHGRYGIDLSINASPAFGEEEAIKVKFASMLRRNRSSAPERLFVDGRLLSLRVGGIVVAGFSPLTILFPSARKPELSVCPPWYGKRCKEWFDPTKTGAQIDGSDEEVPAKEVQAIRPLMKKWVTAMHEWLRTVSEANSPLLGERQMLIHEFKEWASELNNEVETAVGLENKPVRVVNGEEADVSPILSCQLFSVTVAGRPVSHLVEHNGRVLLSRELLGDKRVVLHGNITGSSQLADRWAYAEAFGDHLGKALGLPPSEVGSLPLKYALVDKLFCDRLHEIVESEKPDISNHWKVMTADEGAYLLPLQSSALDLLSVDEIWSGFTSTDVPGNMIKVSLMIGGEKFEKLYGMSGDDIVSFDGALDMRLFPSYDLSTVSDRGKMLPKESDRCYYTRIRLSPDKLATDIKPIFSNGDKTNWVALANEYKNYDDNSDYGATKSQLIPVDRMKLSGFNFDGLGMILLKLPEPVKSIHSSPRTIAIDFGTSNSCIASQNSEFKGEMMIPEPNTTTLLNRFSKATYGGKGEGHAAMFDFFPFFNQGEGEVLYDDEYFPTQMASRQKYFAGANPGREGGFDPRNGLICYKSLARMMQTNLEFVNTITEFAKEDNRREAPIHLRDRIKWVARDNSEDDLLLALRRIFHEHLRLQLIHNTARRGEYVSRIRASYPRTFTPSARISYERELEHVWQAGSVSEISLQTESAAAAAHIGAKQMQDHFLIDVGGGTSDVCLFKNGSLQIESSFKLASDKVDSVILSPGCSALRKAIVREIKKSPGITSKLIEDLGPKFEQAKVSQDEFEGEVGATKERGLLYAILGVASSSERSFNALCEAIAEKDLNEPAVQRLFHTVLFLFCGLTYFAGRMYRSLLGDTQPEAREACVSFVGNGSKHRAWLSSTDQDALNTLLAEIFRKAAELSHNVSIKVDFLPQAKASVALGLATGTPAATIATAQTKVYNSIEARWLTDDKPCSLDDFYRILDESRESKWNYEKSHLRSLAEAIQGLLDDGKLGSRQILAKHHSGWADELCSTGDVGNKIGRRLMQERSKFRVDLESKKTGLGLEPLEIAELAGLLDSLNSNR